MTTEAILDDTPRVLVVDDDRSMRMMLRKALERDGYLVAEAETGVKALECYRSTNPDVILMDANMPEMDGFTACARLQELPGGEVTPILMVTGLSDAESVERAFSSGATDYITKPVNLAVLRHRVRRVVDGGRARKHLDYLAFHDSLTGLPNRTLFLERLTQALANTRRNRQGFALLFFDLDGFKLINDTLGHDIGDLLLKDVAERGIACVRESDTVARLGGDEFVLLLHGVSSERDVSVVAQKLLAVLATPYAVAGHELHVTASIGIARCPADGEEVRTLLKSADMAMYRAKDHGRNTHRFYTPHIGAQALARLTIESGLRKALERDELVVHYQPLVRLNPRGTIGVEALVRWQHPQLGLLPPGEFIPVAEETDLIAAVGERVLRIACAEVATWQDPDYPPIRVAVNLSGRQLSREDLIVTVRSILSETGLPPNLLQLELTETVVMKHAERYVPSLHELKGLGMGLSIDDFGTGYSSLSYLKRLPVDTVKIDRSFVADIPGDEDSSAIVSAIIAMAHSLRLIVTAEGVETDEQMRLLQSLGCDQAQGYLIARPMPASACRSWLWERRSSRSNKERLSA